MPIHAALHHQTRYTYDRPVSHGPHVVRLRPAPHCRTRVLSYSQKITGGEHFINWQQDPFANWNARLVFPEPMRELCVEVELVVELAVYNPFDFFIEEAATDFPFRYDASLKHDLAPFLEPCALSPKLAAYLAGLKRDLLGHPEALPHVPTSASLHRIDVHHDGGHLPVEGPEPRITDHESRGTPGKLRTIDFLVGLNQRLQRDIRYLIRLEPGVQSPEETLTTLSGSCRDSGWLLVQLLRHFGLAARFVSGYLIQLAPDVKALDGPSGTEVDFTDLHAWCEVYLPGAGWIGFDPTSGLLAGEGHIPLSCTPEPGTAAPVSGGIGECESKLHHAMRVTRVYESPRVTKPYTEEQWAAIEQLGHAIDADLNKHDVRLTMGGEPTFISIDDPDGPEWNFSATSPKKRVLSDTLLKRLRRKFAPNSLVHYGQGKWYPGESLPRWAFGCYWRKDGLPIWQRDEFIAREGENYQHTTEHSAKFITALSTRLGADPRWIMPGFEDPFYHVWKERRLPANVDPHQANLKDDEDRIRLARILEQGLDSVVGHVLPVQRGWREHAPVWVSGPWFLRAERLYLTPGDSPMGLRLPLDSLPWVKEADYPYIHELDPTAERPPLPPPEVFRQRYLRADTPERRQTAALRRRGLSEAAAKQEALRDDPTRVPKPGESAAWIVRTALCVEPRQGKLHVFMPPVATIEDYLELVAAIEDTAAELGLPVALEGYPPPRDPRLNVLKVTPDPGVIEVNLHPSKSWNELVERTTLLYEEARQTRLGTEKFMVDGRHTGTGGGNHILIGGDTPADSPVLRRPDLLRSLIAYWQNHPSLSWLFSGLFIGPTSQAPRVDEARNDSLH
jgi:transglutaminase-like putative cysteine protease